MSTAITALAAVPLVRGDPWEWTLVAYTDPEKTAREDLTGVTVAAEIRWDGGEQAVTVTVTYAPNGTATLSLTAAETLAMPLGQIPTLFIAFDDTTRGKGPIEVQEGYSN